MAKQEQIELLGQGRDVWNKWRAQHSEVKPDLLGVKLSGADLSRADLNRAYLSGADLSRANLSDAKLIKADLSGANLTGAKLIKADLKEADLRGADLSRAHLYGADLSVSCLHDAKLSGANLSGAKLTGAYLIDAYLTGAYLIGAYLTDAKLSRADLKGANLRGAYLYRAKLDRVDLSKADLYGANLSGADLYGANLSGADLSRATLVRTNLTRATLTQCTIYGISVWNVELDGAKQENLVITDKGEPMITVDNLEVAQFIYLLLNNTKIRDVINTITTKVVLILGRFTPDRKAVLDALRETLRQQDYLPVLFDFEKPDGRNFTETIRTLAHLAHFIIADLTEPSSIPQELQAIIPNLAVSVQPVLLEGKREYAMFADFLKTYDWVLPIHFYEDQASLLASLKEQIIEPAEQKAKELEKKRM